MARAVGIGRQNFEKIVSEDTFYVDKTNFIREWWEYKDDVTLITRPRRFGKTLNMSMVECFFSVEYAGRGELFKNLAIWQDEKYPNLQGTYPVIALSFADVKESSFINTRKKICQILTDLYNRHDFLLGSSLLNEKEKEAYGKVSAEMEDYVASGSLKALSEYMSRYYGKKVIILLDEYDTPMQEAYLNGYWMELADFIRKLFNASFKTNPYLERAILTGITRISKESIFSDLNNLEVVTTTSEKYRDAFGFTQQEVSTALEEYGLSDTEEEVKEWYDGFTFGSRGDIYNPWSIINYLDKGRFAAYWANTSSNTLVGNLIRGGDAQVKMIMEDLLAGKTIHVRLDEQVIFSQLDHKGSAVWSLLLASGYLKVEHYVLEDGRGAYELALTNKEVRLMFEEMVEEWFAEYTPAYNEFVKALLLGDLEAMNEYMNRVAGETFSYFDTGGRASGKSEPERFYHGFVLGLMVGLKDKYVITSNRESGFGRYDIMLEPRVSGLDAFVIEFKVYNPRRDATLEDTVKAAHTQIEEMGYTTGLTEKGIPAERIREYGFAFEGKNVLIG